MPASHLAGHAFIDGGSGLGLSNRPSIRAVPTAPVRTVLLGAGQGIPSAAIWGGRTSSAYHRQPDGTYVETLAGELRVEGARRVENKFTNFASQTSGLLGGAEPGHADPRGGNEAYKCAVTPSANGPSGFKFKTTDVHHSGSQSGQVVVWLRADSNTNVQLFTDQPESASSISITLTTTWKKYFLFGDFDSGDEYKFGGVAGPSANTSFTCYVYAPQGEVTDSTVPQSEVLGGVDYGYGVDGVRYFTYENGNTVDANGVVTEAEGPELQGEFSLLLEPERTNLLLTPDAPATQTVAVPEGVYIVSMVGAGSVALSGSASGIATESAPLSINSLGGSVTFTVSGDVAFFQCEAGGNVTSPCAGTRTADGALHFNNVPSAATPNVEYIDYNGDLQELSGMETALCTYDAETETLAVGYDTTTTRRIVSVIYDA